MRLLTASDLHMEFGSWWAPPPETAGDVLILAGDLITLSNYGPLDRILNAWKKPVLYVPGNHEYYTGTAMDTEEHRFREWLAANHPHVTLLLDEGVTIGGVNFFGGTGWTDFDGSNKASMEWAASSINDYRLIRYFDGQTFTPAQSVALHRVFKAKLQAWFLTELSGPRVVITHTAPVLNPHTKFRDSPLQPAFNSLDMVAVIERFQPGLWIYGHTHECDDQRIGRTRVLSNQRGYPQRAGGFECPEFDPAGCPIESGFDVDAAVDMEA